MKRDVASQRRRFAYRNYFIIAGILILFAYGAFALYQNSLYGNVRLGGGADLACPAMDDVTCPLDKITKTSAANTGVNGFIPVFYAGTPQGNQQIAFVRGLADEAKAECEKRCNDLAKATAMKNKENCEKNKDPKCSYTAGRYTAPDCRGIEITRVYHGYNAQGQPLPYVFCTYVIAFMSGTTSSGGGGSYSAGDMYNLACHGPLPGSSGTPEGPYWAVALTPKNGNYKGDTCTPTTGGTTPRHN